MAASKNQGVRYGIKNLYYAVWDEDKATYGTPIPIPGVTTITLTPQGTTWTFNADDCVYESGSTNSGYTVSFSTAYITDEMAADLFGYSSDEAGMQYETADDQPKSVALLWEFEGSKIHKRSTIYNFKAGRMTTEGNTTNDSTTPDVDTVEGTASGRDFSISGDTKNVIKGSVVNDEKGKKLYDSYFSKVHIPGETVGEAA